MTEHAKKIAKGSLSVMLAAWSIIIIGFFFHPILKRMLGLSSYGTYAILLSAYSIALPLVVFGLFNSVRKHMGEVSKIEKIKIAGCGYRLSLSFGIITLIIGLAVVLLFERMELLEEELIISLLIIVPALSLMAFYETSRSILFGFHRESKAESLRVVEKLIAFAVGLSLVYIGFGIPGVFFGILVSLLVVSAAGYVFVNNRIRLNLGLISDGFKRYRNQVISFGGLTLISMLLAQALYHSDILLIFFLLNDTAKVGAYKTALVLAEMLWLIPIAFQSVLLHYVSEMWKKGKIREMDAIISSIAKYATLAMILLGFGLLVLAEPFMKTYWGSDVEGAVLPLQILIIGSLGFGLARIINPLIEGTGYIKAGIRISAGIVALNIVLNIILIPIYGIMGAAIATSISYFTKLIQYSYLLKKSRVPVLSNFPAKRLLVLAVLFLLILYSMLYLPIPGSLILVVVPLSGFTIFLLLSRLLGLFKIDELKKIIALLR
jgi:O-antigen/teichoic acid export membrane protein